MRAGAEPDCPTSRHAEHHLGAVDQVRRHQLTRLDTILEQKVRVSARVLVCLCPSIYLGLLRWVGSIPQTLVIFQVQYLLFKEVPEGPPLLFCWIVSTSGPKSRWAILCLVRTLSLSDLCYLPLFKYVCQVLADMILCIEVCGRGRNACNGDTSSCSFCVNLNPQCI